MPELPEVETVDRGLEKLILGKKISNIDIRYPKMIKTDLDEFLRKCLVKSFKQWDVVVNIYFSIYPTKF